MKKNTEIKIEMSEDGSWRASSLDYPGWECSGTGSFGSADVAAKGLEEWSKKKVCPVCGRQYLAPPAISRNGMGDICPVCGAAESIFFLSEEDRQKIVDEIEKREIAAGRVMAIPV